MRNRCFPLRRASGGKCLATPSGARTVDAAVCFNRQVFRVGGSEPGLFRARGQRPWQQRRPYWHAGKFHWGRDHFKMFGAERD